MNKIITVFCLFGKYALVMPILAACIVCVYVLAPVLFLINTMVLLNGPDETNDFFREWYVEFPLAVWKWIRDPRDI